MKIFSPLCHLGLFGCCLGIVVAPLAAAAPAAGSIWAHENIHAWSVAPFDSVKRTPEERLAMLQRLGLKYYAYSWREVNIPTFEAEIIAAKKHGIALLAWNLLSVEIDEAPAKAALEAFRRQNVHPQLWVMHSPRGRPRTPAEWGKLMPPGTKLPASTAELQQWPAAEREKYQEAMKKATRRLQEQSFTKSPEEQRARVIQEADRIKKIVDAAAPYGVKVSLYPHNTWFGIMDNQVAIIERLKTLGVTNVGIVYNFNHARDHDHDDTKHFPAIWKKIQPYVVAVNITGIAFEDELIYPSQGDSELEMMRTIQNSGWKGPVGIIAEKGGDAEVTLKNYLRGIDWLAAEINRPGSGGPRPFPRAD
jgi:sugar phosphate isomerase/epimerase